MTRNRALFEKAESDSDNLYDVFRGQDGESAASVSFPKGTLSTRYVPNMPGVQAKRISDQIYADPITNKVYDYNEGFSIGDVNFPAYSVSMQTSIYALSEKLKELGFKKESSEIINIINNVK